MTTYDPERHHFSYFFLAHCRVTTLLPSSYVQPIGLSVAQAYYLEDNLKMPCQYHIDIFWHLINNIVLRQSPWLLACTAAVLCCESCLASVGKNHLSSIQNSHWSEKMLTKLWFCCLNRGVLEIQLGQCIIWSEVSPEEWPSTQSKLTVSTRFMCSCVCCCHASCYCSPRTMPDYFKSVRVIQTSLVLFRTGFLLDWLYRPSLGRSYDQQT